MRFSNTQQKTGDCGPGFKNNQQYQIDGWIIARFIDEKPAYHIKVTKQQKAIAVSRLLEWQALNIRGARP